ncbi:MAG TPA: hypothetical protein VGM92_08530 [Candidatus Kapabacteria bacterium]|jgi:hypothetical protein
MSRARIIFLCILLAVVPIVLVACNQGTTATSSGSVAFWTVPRVGATYVFSDHDTSQGISEFRQVDTLVVIRTEQHLAGKEHVLVLYDRTYFDTAFYNYEPNGDISEGQRVINDTTDIQEFRWYTNPTGSQEPTALEVPENIIQPDESRYIFSDSSFFIATESVATPAAEFETLHIIERSIDDNIEPNKLSSSSLDTSIENRWFAPSIGFFTKMTVSDRNAGRQFLSEALELVHYNP